MAMLFNWTYKLTVIRRPSSGFIGSNPQFFENIGNALEITKMSIKFEVKRSLGKEPNTCKIVVRNLADHTRAELDRQPLTVMLAAGYDNQPRLLFSGDVLRSWSQKKGNDWETHIHLHDGGRALAHARTNKSYKAPVSILQILTDAAKTFGMELPKNVLADPSLKQSLPVGLSLSGPTRDVLGQVLAPYGYNFSVQNGRLQILKDGELAAGEAFLINQSTGLIDSPQKTSPDSPKKSPELTFDVLLYPELLPGHQVKVESEQHNGVFRIKELSATGDTHGDDWKTSVRAVPQ